MWLRPCARNRAFPAMRDNRAESAARDFLRDELTAIGIAPAGEKGFDQPIPAIGGTNLLATIPRQEGAGMCCSVPTTTPAWNRIPVPTTTPPRLP